MNILEMKIYCHLKKIIYCLRNAQEKVFEYEIIFLIHLLKCMVYKIFHKNQTKKKYYVRKNDEKWGNKIK